MSIDINFKELKKLIRLIEESQVSEIEIQGQEGDCIRVAKGGVMQTVMSALPPLQPPLS